MPHCGFLQKEYKETTILITTEDSFQYEKEIILDIFSLIASISKL